MLVVQSTKAKGLAVDPQVEIALRSISQHWLEEVVRQISIPRHYVQEPANNQTVASWIEAQLKSYGYRTDRQGQFHNITTRNAADRESIVLVGAHYDSVPRTPGADDNASAVAAMLGCAKAVAEYAAEAPVCFVAFNREEDDLLGSKDFVASCVKANGLRVREAHVLEMVGYCDHTPGSQTLPKGLPIKLVTDRGDFLALLGNRRATRLVDALMRTAKGYLPTFPVLGLKIYCGLERFFRHLRRSDHAPFWSEGIPALMWTDTAEFRNSNYHKTTDTPDTLDYEFLLQVTRLLTARVLIAAGGCR